MAALRALARSTLHASRSAQIARSRTTAAGSGVLGRRHASFYNTDIAGLTEEQAEVRSQIVSKI